MTTRRAVAAQAECSRERMQCSVGRNPNEIAQERQQRRIPILTDVVFSPWLSRPVLRRYWTTACQNCSLKFQCTTGPEWRITRWEHEQLLEAVQQRLDANPKAMRQRRETVEHPCGTMKARVGATHFLTKTLPKVAAEMALSVLAYNLTRVMNIVGMKPLVAAIAA